MPVNVLMPQMGESITEGTIVRWFKKEGEEVAKDEPLLEISTDKVDAEVPAPASGKLAKIVHGPGATVPVETVIGVIGQSGEAADVAPASKAEAAPPPSTTPTPFVTPPPAPPARQPAAPVAAAVKVAAPAEEESELVRRRSSPLVRRIAAEHGVDLAAVTGTGLHGRVTKEDIFAFVEAGKVARPSATPKVAARPAAPPSPAGHSVPFATGATLGPSGPFTGDELREPMSVMRQKIAEHMVLSRKTSPHVHTVFEADMSRVVALREGNRAAFEAQHGIKLTFTPFFVASAIEALKAFPVVNATLDGSEIVYHRHINIGVAVALPHGLIVPVVKRAEELSFIGLQRAVTDLATRARNKQLKPEDVQGSTFSITNPGPYGGLYGLPIINQPNVAILSTGGIQRRPVVVTDEFGREAIAIRDMVYLALSFDHRLVDGATADQFMAVLKATLEAAEFEMV